ncbi:NFACT family protein [Fructilactobacillus cliffordii]|uniref:Rqc2 family fibronectin-binding protein n=1 Tax=Fructilactobacillus cliffordii TaxID=2940299 RepID=UPI002093009F|nr:NFACT RNA binding domain-containing protein [Fructilactobacillus cliffordii]USS86655.1 NFACT family protein [Fructilactobacillus cliffordii]
MSFDGSFTHAMVNELQSELIGGRITKISEPYPNEIIITVRAQRQNYQVLLSANPTYARIQTTTIPFQNPPVPNNFTMTLRKHLQGSFINQIHQVDNDRIVHLHINTRNEIGDLEELVLVIEIMARHSNIMLVEAQNRNIIDVIKRIGPDKNRFRTILPGSKYVNPPQQDLLNPFQLSDFSVIEHLDHDFPNLEVLAGELRKHLQGLGIDTSFALAEALHQSGGSLQTKYTDFWQKFNHPSPVTTLTRQGKLGFAPFPFPPLQIEQHFTSLSTMLDQFYQTKVQRERVREQGAQLIQITRNELKKNRKKIKRLEKDETDAANADQYRVKGEVLMTYLHQVKPGMNQISLPNFYDNNQPIEINLKVELSPSANAQWYFKQFQKKKNAGQYIQQQIQNAQAEIDYFENIESQIELANPENLDDIKTELQQSGYLKRQTGRQNKKVQVSQPEKFMATDGTVILVGKNNLQNDKLTLKTADKRETWLHTQNIHGSHVIIRSFDPSEQTILEAANLAAYFSKARASANVPVDYDLVKRVKKPNGAKPGLVHYTGQKTVYVTPNQELVEQLRRNAKK